MVTITGTSISHEEMDIDDSISANASPCTLRAACPDVFQCSSLLDAVKFIIDHNTHQKNIAALSLSQEDMFKVIEELRECPQKMFKYLHDHFVKHFDIYLYIIGFDNGKFSLLNKITDEKKYTTFITFNKDHTVRGPLFITNVNGTTQTVFTRKNKDILLDAQMYICQLNDFESSNGAPQIQEQQAVYCERDLRQNLSTNSIPASADQSDIFPVDIKAQSRIVLNQMLQQLFRIIDGLPLDPRVLCQTLQPFVSHVTAFKDLSPIDTIMASKDGINHLQCLVQSAEQFMPVNQTEPSDGRNQQTAEIPNETALDTSLPDNTDDVEEKYSAPKLSKPVEKTIHPRNLKEFGNTGSAPINCFGSNQRDSMSIVVPPPDENTLCLDIQLVDTAHKTHVSKIPVPHETKAENELLMNNNDLSCLNFSNCDETYTFKRDTKHLYAEISATERQNRQKDIRLHMINLYQRCDIKKAIVNKKDLKTCQLAFSFCIFQNGKYKRVSPIHYSDVIEDSVKGNNQKTKPAKKCLKRLKTPIK